MFLFLFNCKIMSDSLQPHGLQHARLPCPLLSPGVFFNELALHIKWIKYWSFSFSISPSKEYSELISFRIDWFDLLAVQGTLMNCSMPGLPVHHQLPEFTQTHIHRVSDAIQPPHPLLSPSPPVPNPSQHQSLFQ